MNQQTSVARPATRPVIVMEFNELCSPLLRQWMDEGRLPNFARLHAQSDVFTTDADVSDPAQLEPWIQWYSSHTGLAYDQHKVFHLTDGPRAGFSGIHRIALDAGRRVGSFASMNVAPFAKPGSFFVGDPWSENGDASPSELNVYNRFVSWNVREYSNASNRLSLGDYAGFLSFMLGHGLSPTTIAGIVRQLVSERLGDRRLSYKRVALLDRLQFDVFRSYYRKLRPDFATFFLNSTAHLQHSYWRHMQPDAFTIRPDAGEMAVYGDAVRFGYEAMDKLVGSFAALADRSGAMLVFMTALSQQPFLRHEEFGGQHFHRPHNVERFLKQLGIAYVSVDPTMTHQYMAHFASDADRDTARARLSALSMKEGGRRVFDFPTVEGAEGLYFGCQISTNVGSNAIIIDESIGTSMSFGSVFYRIDAIKSGRHHPNGALWFRTGRGRVHEEHVSILDVFPTILDLLAVPLPRDADYRGRSMASRLLAAEAATV